MISLRKQLLCWLAPLYIGSAIIAAFVAYVTFGWAVDFFMDNQLRVFAESHAAVGEIKGPLPTLTRHNVQKGDLIVQMWDRNGRLLATSWPDLDLPLQKTDGFHDFVLDDLKWRAYTLHTPDRTVQIVQCVNFRAMVIREHVLGTSMPVLLLIPLSIAILWCGIRMSLRGVERVARAAEAQDERNLCDLPVEHAPGEIHPLVNSVNKLLGRLRDAFSSQRRFVQDAAHELRTPITAMTLQLENLKVRVNDPAALEQVAQLEAGLARTKRLVEQLLRLARQEAVRPSEPPTPVDLDAVLKDAVASLLPIADRRRIDLGFAASACATTPGRPEELRSLFHNLIDNALRYTPEGGVVDVALHNDAGVVTVEVIDSGPGIAPELLPRVFDRFFRIEGADAHGSGLGLAIAKNAAERNDATLELVNRTDASGLIARVRFVNAHARDEAPAPTAVEWSRIAASEA
jgi:two-component system, OmpR family, sensor kinase